MKGGRFGLLIIGLILLSAVGSASLTDFWSSLFNEPTAPQLVSAHADPLKVRPGQVLNVYVQVKETSEVTNALALFYHEDGFDEVPLTMIASTPHGERTYKASWEVHSTLDQVWYETIYAITNEHGETLNGKVMWQDPTVSHTPDEILPGTFNAGTYIFPDTVNMSNLECEDCVGNDAVNTSDLSLQCTEFFSSVSTGTDSQDAQATVPSTHVMVAGGCLEGVGSGLRWLTQDQANGVSQWICSSNDGAGSVSASLQAYAMGCQIT